MSIQSAAAEGRRPAQKNGLIKRYARNPILSADAWQYSINTVFNAGATRLPDGSTLLLCRVEDRRGLSHLSVARSADGVTDWQVDRHPTLAPDAVNYPEEIWGIEDPRIVWVPELGRYAVTYTSFSRGGPGISLAMTEDFRCFERVGPIMPPEDKDAALFPRRFNGRWALLHRPIPASARAHIWISFSPDLKHWGDHTMVIQSREGAWWDARKVGLSPPPIETSEGWLVIYHGVRQTPANSIYRLGLALLDLEDPTQCLLRSDEWIFGPREAYERTGDVADVVFPCGYTLGDDPDELRIYYGAADTAIALATTRISRLLAWLKNHSRYGGAAQDF